MAESSGQEATNNPEANDEESESDAIDFESGIYQAIGTPGFTLPLIPS